MKRLVRHLVRGVAMVSVEGSPALRRSQFRSRKQRRNSSLVKGRQAIRGDAAPSALPAWSAAATCDFSLSRQRLSSISQLRCLVCLLPSEELVAVAVDILTPEWLTAEMPIRGRRQIDRC